MSLGGNRLAQAGAIVLIVIALSALAGPLLLPVSPLEINLTDRLQGPSLQHPFGCDQLGRDIFSRVIHGAQVSLLIGVLVTLVSLVAGTALGMFAGYRGGLTDLLMNGLFDVALAVPGLLLAIGVIAVLGPSFFNLVIALCVMGWVGYARLARSLTLRAREVDYVAAARVGGLSSPRILTAHILPNISAPLSVQAAIGMAGVIITESTLSFLGLGGEIDAPSWGAMLNDGLAYLLVAPHLTIFPGAAIAITVLSLNFLGDGLQEHFDPRARTDGPARGNSRTSER
ncbi:MAG TPA: ABC transporter permease [Acidobacteriota bacterium]|nr:ABC transporter permease [Acidobacteriota bacterium]